MNPDEEISQEIEQRNAAIKAMADKQSRTYLRTHKREMDRLHELAKDALIANQPDSYKYAVGKLRFISLQPALDADTMHTMWLTSKTRCDEMIEEAIAHEQGLVANPEEIAIDTTTPVCSL